MTNIQLPVISRACAARTIAFRASSGRSAIIRTHVFRLSRPSFFAAVVLIATLSNSAGAQGGIGGGGGGAGGGGNNTSNTPPAASAPLKKNADRTDPVKFLLDRRKQLELPKQTEDSLKYYRDEMRHMQDVVFKDLDQAATKKQDGQPPSTAVQMLLSTEATTRVNDIQDAYRDRSRLLLSDKQRQQVDSMEAIWKRTEGKTLPVTLPPRRPPIRQ